MDTFDDVSDEELLATVLRAVQEGTIILGRVRYDVQKGRNFQKILMPLPSGTLYEEFQHLMTTHPKLDNALLILVKTNDTRVCSWPDKHQASWHEAYIEHLGITILICDACAEFRTSKNDHIFNTPRFFLF